LTEKRREHADHQSANQAFSVSQESLQTLQQDIKTMIALLDEEAPSPQVMNEWVKKFVLNVTVMRESRIIDIEVNMRMKNKTMYRKNLTSIYE
jgi:site-specific DNA recombinase